MMPPVEIARSLIPRLVVAPPIENGGRTVRMPEAE